MAPEMSLVASALAMTAIIGVRYLAISGAFAWATRMRMPGLYQGKARQIRRELFWSLSAAFIYGVPAGVVAWGWQSRGWTQIYSDLTGWPLWWWPVSVLIYLVAHDTWFYWTHRWMHQPRMFGVFHAVHHQSRPPTAWAAMSFHPWESLTGAIVIPLLVFVVPIHVSALLAVLSMMTIFGVTNHMGWEIFPKAFIQGSPGKWLITASHHDRHHKDYGCNFGLYFRHWDRLCGTDKGLSEWTASR